MTQTRPRRMLANEALRRGTGPVASGQMLPGALASEQQSDEMVYFLRHGDRVKVGTTRRSHRRQQHHHRTADAFAAKYAVLAVVHGTKTEESAVKGYFADIRVDGQSEYFHPADSILDYIRWLRTHYYVAVDTFPHTVPVCDVSGWLPSPERRLPNPYPLLGRWDFGERVITGDDYYTPKELVPLLTAALGGVIDLDPASHPVANAVIEARRFYQRADDGLRLPWAGAVWLNPPFSTWDRWAEKLLSEVARGEITELLALVAAPGLPTQYFAPVLRAANLFLVFPRRLRFWGPHVLEGSGPAAGHGLVYFGPNGARVAQVFRDLGVALVPLKP